MPVAIDLGSNSVRLLWGEVEHGVVVPHCYLRRITRLAGGASASRGLAPEAMQRTLDALVEFADFVTQTSHGGQVRAVATEAVRRAVNGRDFLAKVREVTGLAVELIAGEEEARLSAAGVRSCLDPQPPAALLFDIGGGSTEFILYRGDERLFHRSYPLGVVALAEQERAGRSWQNTVTEILAGLTHDLAAQGVLAVVEHTDCELIGTAGTVTTLAALALQMSDYDWRRVNNYRLSRDRVVSLLQQLEPLTPAEREALPGLEVGRGDLILPGAYIVQTLLHRLRKPSLRVSDFGLLEGVLLSIA